MKHALLFIALTLFSFCQIHAQQTVSVIDKDTRDPVPRVFFIHEGDTIAYTSLQGIALVPKVSGMITLSCKDYKTIELNADSLPAVIRMKCLTEHLDEVVVIGKDSKSKKKFDLPDNILLEYDLNDAYKNSGKIFASSLYKLIGYKTKKERKRKKLKQQLDAYTLPPPDESTKK